MPGVATSLLTSSWTSARNRARSASRRWRNSSSFSGSMRLSFPLLALLAGAQEPFQLRDEIRAARQRRLVRRRQGGRHVLIFLLLQGADHRGDLGIGAQGAVDLLFESARVRLERRQVEWQV